MIAGFALTGVNYAAAVQVLQNQYGKEIAIQRAHINDLLQLPPVFSDRDIPRLRKLLDDCEAISGAYRLSEWTRTLTLQ